MRRVILIGCSIFAVAGMAFGIGRQPTPVSAGGLPCFLCHGVNFEGSDIAPTVAGTKLTDEQILKQMRHPRGVMPAFGPNDWPDAETAISYIRAQPTGKPTLALSDQQRSAALALIAGVASARATEYARPAGSSEVLISFPTTPTPAASPTPSTSSTRTAPPFNFGALAAIGGLLLGMVAVVWVRARR
jgi:cbb3-type cytochrome c oxidase subunit III